MDPRDFLQVAKSLLKVDNTANCRTVFNRSYYAAYNVAVCFIEGLKEISVKISKGPSGHGEVRRYLGNCGESDLEIAHQRLLNLSNDRIKADYRLNSKNVEKMNNAKMAVLIAEEIIKTCDSYSTMPGRKKVADGIRVYLGKISPH
jgi:hypothetical protein